MTYPIRATQPQVTPNAAMSVTFRPALPDIVTATVIVHGRQPQAGGGGGDGTPPPGSVFRAFTTAARLEIFKPGSAEPAATVANSKVITAPVMSTRLVLTAVADAADGDLAADWSVRVSNAVDGTVTHELGPARYDVTIRYQTRPGNLGKVDHIVVLMMENRSFDHLLGYLSLPGDGGRPDVNGLTGTEFNRGRDGVKHLVTLRTRPTVPPPPGVAPYPATAFLDDPGHGWDDVTQQLSGGAGHPSNAGFVLSFADQLDRDAIHLPPLLHRGTDSGSVEPEGTRDVPFRPARPGRLTVTAVAAGHPAHSETGSLGSLSVFRPGLRSPVVTVRVPLEQPGMAVTHAVTDSDLAAPGSWTARIFNATTAAVDFTTRITYVEQDHDRSRQEQPEAVMSYYHAEHIPVYDLLARQFAICDNWFASLPTDTWPNRLYAMTGGSGGLINTPSDSSVSSAPPGYTLRTIFEVLQDAQVDWGYYFSDLPFALVFKRLAQDAAYTSRMRGLDGFYALAETGELPSVSWLEPNFTDVPDGPGKANDDHPPGDIARGQALVGQIYAHLTASPSWPKTLMIITYDEHGGFYDHVLPPPDPEDDLTGLRKYGVRVPAFLVTPYVPPGSVSTQVYDHTSLLSTILHRFCLAPDGSGPDMGRRTGAAAHVGSALTRQPTSFRVPAPPAPTAGALVPEPATDRMSFGTALHTALFGF